MLCNNCFCVVPVVLQEIMRNQYELFMALAAQVGALHEHVSDLREQYLRLRPNEPNFFVEAERRAAANTLRSKHFLIHVYITVCASRARVRPARAISPCATERAQSGS